MRYGKPLAAGALLGLGCACLLAMWFFSYSVPAEYGTGSGSLLEGARDGFGAGIWFGIAATGFALSAVRLAAGSKVIWLSAALVVVAAVGGPFVGGALAAKQKHADLLDVPYCYTPSHAPELRARLRPVDRAFRQLDHPAAFAGGGSYGYAGCGDGLLDVDMSTARAHYRKELPRHGWTVHESRTEGVLATRGRLEFRLSRQDGLPTVHIGPVNPTLP